MAVAINTFKNQIQQQYQVKLFEFMSMGQLLYHLA